MSSSGYFNSWMKHIFFILIHLFLLSCGSIEDYKYYREGQSVNLSKKGLKEFPEHILNDTTIRVLKLYGNEIDSIPNGIGGMKNLEKLYIGKNNLVYISSEISKLEHLKMLSAQYNELETLPDSLMNCNELEQLILNQNKLTHLPVSLGKLKKLENLQLDFNRLDSIPESIGDCINLRYISLNRNFLKKLPSTIGQLQKLRDLKLVNAGPLLDVPEELCGLRNLDVLEVDRTIALPQCLLVLQTTRLRIIVH